VIERVSRSEPGDHADPDEHEEEQGGLEHKPCDHKRKTPARGEPQTEPEGAALAVGQAVALRREVAAHPGAGIHPATPATS
jgi:hypothetical protein